MSLSINIGRPFLNDKTLDEQARSVLRLYGTDAHVYLPGANGVAVSGLPTNNYTISDGSTGYSAVDGTAGLVLDGAGALGAEAITGGTFGNAGDWGLGSGWSVSGNLGIFAGTSAFSQIINTAAVAAIGSTNLVTFTVASAGANVTSVRIVLGGSFSVSRAISGPGTYSVYAVNLGASTSVAIQSLVGSAGAADAFSLSYLSCKTVTGIHATQATTANKPALRRGLYNRQNYSNDLLNAGFTAANLSKSAGYVTRTSTAASCYLNSPAFTASFAVGEKITAYAKVKAKSLGGYFGLRPSGTYPDRLDGLYNLNTGAVVGQANGGGFSGAAATIAGPDSSGFYIVAVSGTVGTTACVNIVSGPCDSTATVSSWEATQSTLSDVYIESQGISSGIWTAQQILAEGGIPLTTSAAASNPSAGRYSWQFDGSNDSLALGSVPFQMSDDHAVIAGLQLGANSTTRYALNPAAGAGSQRVGSIFINASNNIGAGWTDDAAAANIQSPATYTGQTVVASCVKQTNAKRLRVNGAQAGATDNTVMGTTTLTTGGAIGDWKSGGGNQWIGAIGPVILIKGTVSDADLLTLERWVASQTPNGPQF